MKVVNRLGGVISFNSNKYVDKKKECLFVFSSQITQKNPFTVNKYIKNHQHKLVKTIDFNKSLILNK